MHVNYHLEPLSRSTVSSNNGVLAMPVKLGPHPNQGRGYRRGGKEGIILYRGKEAGEEIICPSVAVVFASANLNPQCFLGFFWWGYVFC